MNDKTQVSQDAQHQEQDQTQSKNAPIDVLRDGALRAAIFKNERENGVNYSIEPGRLYTDAEGQYRESKTFSGSEPLRLAKLMEKAYERVSEFRQQMREQNNQERER